MTSKFEKDAATGSTSTAKGFFNLKVGMKSGKKAKLGGILDGDNLDKKSRELLEKLMAFSADGKSITLHVDYNAFSEEGDTDDDFA